MAGPQDIAALQAQGNAQSQMSPEQQLFGGQSDMGSGGGPPQAQAGPPPQGPNPATSQMQPDPDMGTYGANQDTGMPEQIENLINFALTTSNIAKIIKKKKKKKDGKDGEEILREMGVEIVKGYEADEVSRESWMKQNEEWLKMAMLVRENKSFPWPKASNVKYPLLATAAMQFTARAYPALVPTDGHIVKTRITQMNPQDQIYAAGERVCQHMSFQILERIPDWEENMDKLLMTMAISGICFKKTYYHSVKKRMCSDLVYPENLCINYFAKSLATAYRKTEILEYNDNDVREKVKNNEEFLELDLGKPVATAEQTRRKNPIVLKSTPPADDESTPHVFLACHTFWDLDEDGYEEPYIITVHKETKQVVRITARWCLDDVHRDENNKIILIEPLEYFIDFPFIPNPDGSVYALGFGLLIGNLNEPVNSIFNMLMDAGTLNNLQSGLIGKGLRLRMGQLSLQPGEFKLVNATGEDLQKSVYPWPTKEPSQVLFNLLKLLLDSGNQLASIAEIFVGKMPGQNTPATTTQETIQQGMAVFTAIYKRVYRSLKKEFQKLYYLNKICPEIVKEESMIAGVQLQQSDYDLPMWTIIPGADPSGDSATVRMAKMQQVQPLLQMGTVDPMYYSRQMLDALEIPNAQQWIRQPQPPPPDPKQEQTKLEMQQSQQEHQQNMQAGQQDLQIKAGLAQIEKAKKEQELVHIQQMNSLKQAGEQAATHNDMIKDTIEQHGKAMKDTLDAIHSHVKMIQGMREQHVEHQQNVVHTQVEHEQKMVHQNQEHRQTLKLKAKEPKMVESKK